MRVTASILCYNYGRFLRRAIDSVLEQRNVPPDVTVEILVIDDGSTDCTPQVCAEYGNRIVVHRSRNEGFGPSLTKAVTLASGDSVCFLDADDWFHEDKLAAVVPHLRGGALFVESEALRVDEAGNLLDPMPIGAGSTSTLCVRRDAALALCPVENEVYFHALALAGHGVRLEEGLTYYRMHTASMTNRSQAGRQNAYLASVTHGAARRVAGLSQNVGWLNGSRHAQRVSCALASRAHYNELEAALELGKWLVAWKALAQMYAATLRAGRMPGTLHAKMLARAVLNRPSFPKSR